MLPDWLMPAVRRRIEIAVWAFTRLIPLAVLVVVLFEWNGLDRQSRDTIAYYGAAAAVHEGLPLYDPKPPRGPHEHDANWFYLYPPPFAALLSLLPRMSYPTFDRLWLLGSMVAFWLFAAALARIARGRWSGDGTLRWGAVLFVMPGPWLVMHFGNIELYILALVALGLAVPALGGAALGVAAALKVTPVWPLLALIARHPRATVTGAAAAALACGAASLYAFGAGGSIALSLEWLRDIMPTVGQGQFWGGSFQIFSQQSLEPYWVSRNLSTSFAAVQLAVKAGWNYQGGELPGLVRLYLTGVAVAAPLLTAWLMRRREVRLQVAAVFAAAVFAAPIVRPYALPVILLVLAAHRAEARERAHSIGSVAPPEAVMERAA